MSDADAAAAVLPPAAPSTVDDLTAHLGATNLLIILFFVTLVCVKVVKIFSWPERPKIYVCRNDVIHDDDDVTAASDSAKNGVGGKNIMVELYKHCPMLDTPYLPPFLWGRNGHIQTAVYGVLGHASLARVADRRHFVRLQDDTTVTFDVYETLAPHPKGDFTIALCPGIASSSESNYIRTCVHHAQEAGFRCAVLNHLGALKDVKLTSARIFTYGGTDEYAAMISKLVVLFPKTKLIVVGFSMGGNIITKYLGESVEYVDRILFGMSVCQGYDAIRLVTLMNNWDGFRRIYMYVMTENIKCLLRNHYNEIILPHVKSGLLAEQHVWSATSLLTIDEHFTRKLKGFSRVEDYLDWCSSINFVPKIKVPMIFVNALDDPLVPYPLLEPVMKFCESKPNFMFVLTKHGGHLGFLEGTSICPKSVSWLDRLIVQLSNGVINLSY